MTVREPSCPTAPPTSSLPSGAQGQLRLRIGDVATDVAVGVGYRQNGTQGAAALDRRVRLAPWPFRALPIMEAPASVRPKAAVATGRVLWICRARSVRSRLLIAAACTKPSDVIARKI